MSELHFGESYGGTPPENYERFFVPAIGAPLARDLVSHAALRPGERVLDVACGTGVVARLAAERVGPTGTVAGLDLDPGMLRVARATASPGTSIEWHEGSAESMPLPDEAFDVVLCQMGLQFMSDRPAALREMRRVLSRGGRLLLNLPGPAAPAFASLEEALEAHIGPEAGGFLHRVFSLHEAEELQGLLREAGFRDAAVQAGVEPLQLPAGSAFLWQYVHSTPLAGAVAGAGEEAREALERDVLAAWEEFEVDGSLVCRQRVVLASAWN